MEDSSSVPNLSFLLQQEFLLTKRKNIWCLLNCYFHQVDNIAVESLGISHDFTMYFTFIIGLHVSYLVLLCHLHENFGEFFPPENM